MPISAIGKTPETNSATYSQDHPKYKKLTQKPEEKTASNISANAKFDNAGNFIINLAKKDALDSNKWYIIKQDGSGFTRTCWNTCSSTCKKNDLKNIYDEAKKLCKKGEIPEDKILKFAEQFDKKSKPVYNMKGFSAEA